MTVERLIELLQRQHPQALVRIRSNITFRFERITIVGGKDVLYPYKVDTTSRDGCVYITCSLYREA